MKSRLSVFIRSIFLLMISAVTLAGCWDVQEVNRRAIANAMFLDITEDNRVKMGLSFHVPGSILPPYNGSEQLFSKRNFTLSAEGKGQVDAWQNLQTHAFRDIYFGQLRAIILSERFARRNIYHLLDFNDRRVQFPSNTYLLVTKENPEKLIDIKTNNNLLPGDYINTFFESPAKTPLAKPIRLWQVVSKLTNGSSDVYMPMIITSQGQYRIAGVALFSRNKMAGELDVDETGTLALLNGNHYGYLTVPLGGERLVAYTQVQANKKIRPVLKNDGTLSFIIEVAVYGLLQETNPRDRLFSLGDKEIFERETETYVADNIRRLLTKLQELNSDPVGFGKTVRVVYPEYWEKIDWHEVYPQAVFQVRVTFRIANTGLFR